MPKREALSAPAAPVVHAAQSVIEASTSDLVAGLSREPLRYWASRGRPRGRPDAKAIDAVPGPNLTPTEGSMSNSVLTADLQGLGLVGSLGTIPPPHPTGSPTPLSADRGLPVSAPGYGPEGGGENARTSTEPNTEGFGGGAGLLGAVKVEDLIGLSPGRGSFGDSAVSDLGQGSEGATGLGVEGSDGGFEITVRTSSAAAASLAAASPPPPLAPRKPIDNPTDGLRYVWIPPATFQMGCVPHDQSCAESEKPRHAVTVIHGFWMSRTEVTVRSYKAYSADHGLSMPSALKFNKNWKHRNHPMIRVSWQEAADFCSWAGGRLPTEVEWEYAGRGGKEGRIFPNGNGLDRRDANFAGKGARDKWEYTSPAGYFPANGFDLHDMAGNVWEWTADGYRSDAYATSDEPGSQDTAPGQARVIRGGSMYSDVRSLRVSYRGRSNAESRLFYIGFRCVRDAAP